MSRRASTLYTEAIFQNAAASMKINPDRSKVLAGIVTIHDDIDPFAMKSVIVPEANPSNITDLVDTPSTSTTSTGTITRTSTIEMFVPVPNTEGGTGGTSSGGTSSGGASSGGASSGAACAGPAACAGTGTSYDDPIHRQWMHRDIAVEFRPYINTNFDRSQFKMLKFFKDIARNFYGVRLNHLGSVVSVEGLCEQFSSAEAFRIVFKYEYGFPEFIYENAIRYTKDGKYLKTLLSLLFGVLSIDIFKDTAYVLDRPDGKLELKMSSDASMANLLKAYKILMNSSQVGCGVLEEIKIGKRQIPLERFTHLM